MVLNDLEALNASPPLSLVTVSNSSLSGIPYTLIEFAHRIFTLQAYILQNYLIMMGFLFLNTAMRPDTLKNFRFLIRYL